jgi:hypothetical protein
MCNEEVCQGNYDEKEKKTSHAIKTEKCYYWCK